MDTEKFRQMRDQWWARLTDDERKVLIGHAERDDNLSPDAVQLLLHHGSPGGMASYVQWRPADAPPEDGVWWLTAPARDFLLTEDMH